MLKRETATIPINLFQRSRTEPMKVKTKQPVSKPPNPKKCISNLLKLRTIIDSRKTFFSHIDFHREDGIHCKHHDDESRLVKLDTSDNNLSGQSLCLLLWRQRLESRSLLFWLCLLLLLLFFLNNPWKIFKQSMRLLIVVVASNF